MRSRSTIIGPGRHGRRRARGRLAQERDAQRGEAEPVDPHAEPERRRELDRHEHSRPLTRRSPRSAARRPSSSDPRVARSRSPALSRRSELRPPTSPATLSYHPLGSPCARLSVPRSRVERQQMKWFALAAAFTLVPPPTPLWYVTPSWRAAALALSGAAAATGVAILRYRLLRHRPLHQPDRRVREALTVLLIAAYVVRCRCSALRVRRGSAWATGCGDARRARSPSVRCAHGAGRRRPPLQPRPVRRPAAGWPRSSRRCAPAAPRPRT